MIRLNVFIQVSDDNRAALVATAKELVEASLKDEGCVAYDFFASTTRADVFMICETWADQPALDAHSATPEFAKFVGEMQKCGKLKLEKFEF